MDYPNKTSRRDAEKWSSPSSPCWANIPQNVLNRIHARLYLADQIRFRAVCCNWNASSGKTRRCYLPWIVKHSTMWSTGHDVYPFPSKLFDPYSKTVHKLSSFCRPKRYPSDCYDHTTAYASLFNGWMLLSHQRDSLLLPRKTCLFLRNVFTNEVIFLPELDLDCEAATFTANPVTSSDCKVLVLGKSGDNLCFAFYFLSKSKSWTRGFVLEGNRGEGYLQPGVGYLHPGVSSVLYMEGKFYCLFYGGILTSYNVSYVSRSVEATPGWDDLSGCWLFKDSDKGIVMVRRTQTNQWSIWELDRLRKSWIAKTELKHTAFFISDKVSFSAPCVDIDGVELDDCRVYYESNDSIECYSLYQMGNISSNDYSWIGKLDDGNMCFIQPPC